MSIPEFKFALREELKDKFEFLPTRAEPKATGWDVRCADLDGIVLKPFEKYKIPLGFRAMPPEDYWFELKPRSSSFIKKHLNCLYGTIDELWEGECVFACQYIPVTEWEPVYDMKEYPIPKTITSYHRKHVIDEDLWNASGFGHGHGPTLFPFVVLESAPRIEFGDRIGQIIPVRRQEMIVKGVSNKEYDQSSLSRGGERGTGGFGSTGDK